MTWKQFAAIAIAAAALLAAAGWLIVRSGVLPTALQAREHAMMRTLKFWRHGSAAVALAAGSGAASAPVDTATLPVPPTHIGVSLSAPGNGQTLANIARAGHWILQPIGGRWSEMPADALDANGELKALPPNANALRVLAEPAIGKGGVGITCTWQGKGEISIGAPGGVADGTSVHQGNLHFRWTNRVPGAALVFTIAHMDATNPVRSIDCRADTTPKDAIFAPELLSLVKGFKVLRFMDWQNANANLPVTWATRHTSRTFDIGGGDGIPVEDMVKLANLNDSDAWFNMPWNGDADYIRRFAQYVHDNLAPGHIAYVECSNEVWNWGFPVSRQAMKEGLARNLGGSDPKAAHMHRYAQRLVEIEDIWASVFKDDPKRLVRVGAGQHYDTYKTQLVLEYGDTARHIDAFATAPYFDYDHAGEPHDLDEIYRRLDKGMADVLALSLQHKAMAAKHGLRYVAYEAGQGVIEKDVPLAQQIQRDPRMYDLTKRYLEDWRTRIGDTIIMFGTVFKIRESGAWGLVEYDSQPASEAPKLRAVQEELAGTSK